ncbi:MAG TPA: hypothetical protein VKP69_05230, partial [Isosphaeraceae bacterium]|nr:hypothetical protein [Isosphaeraceae bacterium]
MMIVSSRIRSTVRTQATRDADGRPSGQHDLDRCHLWRRLGFVRHDPHRQEGGADDQLTPVLADHRIEVLRL